MNTQTAKRKANYDVIYTSELPHYMTLDEMHARLTANIRKTFAQ